MPTESGGESKTDGAPDPLEECIGDFETLGSVCFALGEEAELYERFMDYVRNTNAPTQTDIDEAEGLITVSRRVRGAMDGALFL